MNPGDKSKWLIRVQSWAVTLLAMVMATHLVPGITYESPQALLVAGVLLGLVYEFVRPVLLLLALPLLVLTLTLFRFVLNALLLGVVAALVPGFEIAGFWAAFFGAMIISIILTLFGPSSARQRSANWQAQFRAAGARQQAAPQTPQPPPQNKPKTDTGEGPIIDV